MTKEEERSARTASAILGGVLVPFFAFAYALGAHLQPEERFPWLYYVAAPFSALGPQFPSGPVWAVLMLLNVALWAALWYFACGVVFRAFSNWRV